MGFDWGGRRGGRPGGWTDLEGLQAERAGVEGQGPVGLVGAVRLLPAQPLPLRGRQVHAVLGVLCVRARQAGWSRFVPPSVSLCVRTPAQGAGTHAKKLLHRDASHCDKRTHLFLPHPGQCDAPAGCLSAQRSCRRPNFLFVGHGKDDQLSSCSQWGLGVHRARLLSRRRRPEEEEAATTTTDPPRQKYVEGEGRRDTARTRRARLRVVRPSCPPIRQWSRRAHPTRGLLGGRPGLGDDASWISP